MSIDEFAESIINGAGGLNDFQRHELVIFPYSDRIAASVWTMRCLANPACEGSEVALAAILERREAMKAASQPAAGQERTVPESAWCRLVRFVNEPEPPEVKAELDAKEIDACRNLECDYFSARMSSALRGHCSACKNKRE